ncbi:MAG TPA: CHAT domain-containing tetratricopeptide repeat protein [Pirellulales bacterium]|jgi:CHAT domain-containing protein/Tfp pilus assembly protein PilF|nr:CHAT domain-containing tetratricopeptide repeat protein [Pirellulales bacterium]
MKRFDLIPRERAEGPSARGAAVRMSQFRALLCCALLGIAAVSRASEADDFNAAMDKAFAANKTGDYAESCKQFEIALALAPKVYKDNQKPIAGIMNNLAAQYVAIGEYAKAEPLYLRCIKLKETEFGEDDPSVATTADNLGSLYLNTGRYAEAEKAFNRAIKIDKDWAEPLPYARDLTNLGNLYTTIAQYDKAEGAYQSSLKYYESELGKNHVDVAGALNNLAILYKAMGQYEKALPLAQRSLKIDEDKLGPEHPYVADNLNNIAILYDRLGQFDKEEPLLLRSLKIREAKYGPESVIVGDSLDNLGILYRKQSEFAKAEPLTQRSLKIFESKLGPDHPKVAAATNNLGILYQGTKRFAEADHAFQRALQIREAKFGPDHPEVAREIHNLAGLHALLGKTAPAASEFDRSRHLVRKHVAQVLPLLSAHEQLEFLDHNDRVDLHMALSFGVLHRDDPQIAALSAAWLANGKAVAQETLTQQAALGRDTSDPKLAKAVQDLKTAQTRLANLTNSAKAARDPNYKSELAQLSDQQQQLAKALSAAGGTSTPPLWVELEAIRRALPKQAILVDIARFEPHLFSQSDPLPSAQPAHYAAWLTARSGDVAVIDLGDADTIDRAVAAARQAMQAAVGNGSERGLIQQKGEPEAEKAIQEAWGKVAQRVLTPLVAALHDRDEIILSPDAALWLIPWGALPLDDGRYALEKWNIHYVVSARDLVRTGASVSSAKLGPPRVFANPNYDLPAAEIPAALAAVLNNKAASVKPPLDQLAGLEPLRSAQMFGRVPLLPGTAAEAKAIEPSLTSYAGAPRTYTGDQALEGVFKLLAPPKVLVLSTHGFFLPDQNVPTEVTGGTETATSAKGSAALIDRNGKRVENPLLRCGLLLAGCNNRDQISDRNADDGILTGMEIVGVNLRGTELVVLSACETGLGQVHNGEGVAGLRQAFELAGAKSVVSTLWQIPDAQSARLMSEFFSNLSAGQTKSSALRQAQLSLIKSRRERSGAAHPFFWAAFTVTGE